MTIDELSTLKIYKMTKEQYKRKVENGEIEENAFYFTDEKDNDGALVLVQNVNGKMIDRTIWGSICYGNGKFVAVDSDGVYGATYSTDGIDWFQANGIDDASSWSQVCYGDSKFVAAGTGDKAAYSADGIDWTEVELPVCNNGYYNSICYGNGKFIAVADGEAFVVYSTDGINWESSELPSSYEDPYICYGNDKFVMISDSGPVVISDNGLNWTEYDLPFDTIWRSICYGNGKFVIADSDGSGACGALYSADGINWEYANGLNPDYCWYVFYTNDRFIAFDNYDGTRTIATSTNGINWTEVKTFEEESKPSLLSVCYGNGKYVAVGESDEAWISTDGMNWGEESYISANGKNVTEDLRNLLCGGGSSDGAYVIPLIWTMDEDGNHIYSYPEDYEFDWSAIVSAVEQNARIICAAWRCEHDGFHLFKFVKIFTFNYYSSEENCMEFINNRGIYQENIGLYRYGNIANGGASRVITAKGEYPNDTIQINGRLTSVQFGINDSDGVNVKQLNTVINNKLKDINDAYVIPLTATSTGWNNVEYSFADGYEFNWDILCSLIHNHRPIVCIAREYVEDDDFEYIELFYQGEYNSEEDVIYFCNIKDKRFTSIGIQNSGRIYTFCRNAGILLSSYNSTFNTEISSVHCRITDLEKGIDNKDAVNVEQLNDALGDIETALDSIIAIQNALMDK